MGRYAPPYASYYYGFPDGVNVYQRVFGQGITSFNFNAHPRYVGPAGGSSTYTLVAGHCEEVPGDCGYVPQYYIGEPGVTTFTVYNNAPGLTIRAEQDSVEEGEDVTFTLTRFGGTVGSLNAQLDVRVAVTQNGEFMEGTAPEVVRFAGYDGDPSNDPDPDAERTVTLTLPSVDDQVYERDGSITLTVLPADPSSDLHGAYELNQGLGSGSVSLTVAVTDNDAPAMSISDASAFEGADSIDFTVTVTPVYEKTTVEWGTSDGSAAAPSDYEAAGGELVFNEGETSKTISIKLEDDSAVEGDETFSVTLSNPTVAELTRASAVGTISDDDARPELTITATGDSVEEGETASFTISRALEGGAGPLTFSLTLAQEGDFFKPAGENYGGVKVQYDVETRTATLTIPAGQTSLALNFATDDDSQPEDDGSITLTLAEGAGYAVGDPGSATVEVTDNDVGISMGPGFVIENEPNITFSVSLSRAAGERVTVVAETAEGMAAVRAAAGGSTKCGEATSNAAVTATSLGRDFESKTETLTFEPGETETQFTVAVVNDTIDEPIEECFAVRLSNPSDNAGLLVDRQYRRDRRR